MGKKFEIHITSRKSEERALRAICFEDWKYSQIDGDPLLGDSVYAYLTSHADTEQEARRLLEDQLSRMFTLSVQVLRAKIEETIYDHRYV